MGTAIHAIYEDGVFRPVQPVDLPDHCEVEFEIRTFTSVGGAKVEIPEASPTLLSDRDRDIFLELIDNPPAPNTELRNAIAAYREQYG